MQPYLGSQGGSLVAPYLGSAADPWYWHRACCLDRLYSPWLARYHLLRQYLPGDVVTCAAVGMCDTQTMTASGGTGPYTYAIAAGELPAGLPLPSGGLLSDTPTAGGTLNFAVIATDSSGGSGPYSDTRNCTLNGSGATLSLAPATLPAPNVAVDPTDRASVQGHSDRYTSFLDRKML